MTTPGEIDRIIKGLMHTIKSQALIIENLKATIADLRDAETRRELGFPPRKLTPDYAPYKP